MRVQRVNSKWEMAMNIWRNNVGEFSKINEIPILTSKSHELSINFSKTKKQKK